MAECPVYSGEFTFHPSQLSTCASPLCGVALFSRVKTDACFLPHRSIVPTGSCISRKRLDTSNKRDLLTASARARKRPRQVYTPSFPSGTV